MVKGERALSNSEQQVLVEILKKHGGPPDRLLTLELREGREVVTKKTLQRHQNFLVDLFSLLPRAAPSASSIQLAFLVALMDENVENKSTSSVRNGQEMRRKSFTWCGGS